MSSAIEKMKRDISVERSLKARVKSIEKIFENSQQQIWPLFNYHKKSSIILSNREIRGMARNARFKTTFL